MTRDRASFRRFYAYAKATGLDVPLREICQAHRTTLFDAFTDVKGPTTHAARLECWGWLMFAVNKSTGEIGRLFARDATSIYYGVKRMTEIAEEDGTTLGLETLRALAMRVAARSAEAMSANGRRATGRKRPSLASTLPQERVLVLGAAVATPTGAARLGGG